MKKLFWLPFALAISFAPTPAWPQANDASYEWWREFVETSSLDDLVEKLESGDFDWPKLPSNVNMEEGGATERWLELSKGFIDILGSNVREHRGSPPSDLVEIAVGYFAVESALRKSGGYTNRVLASTFAAYGAEFLVTAIAQDEGLHEKISELLETRKSPCPTSIREFILELIEDDPLLRRYREEVLLLDGDADINVILASMRLNELIPELTDVVYADTTKGLIDSPSALALLGRIDIAEISLIYYLPGYLEFLALGGRRKDFVRGSGKPLRDVMDDAVYKYQYPLYGHRSLSNLGLMNHLENSQNETQLAIKDKHLLE